MNARTPELWFKIDEITESVDRIIDGDPNWFPFALEQISRLTGRDIRNYVDLTSLGSPIPDSAAYVHLGDPHSILIASDTHSTISS